MAVSCVALSRVAVSCVAVSCVAVSCVAVSCVAVSCVAVSCVATSCIDRVGSVLGSCIALRSASPLAILSGSWLPHVQGGTLATETPLVGGSPIRWHTSR